jgi:hypothetical protein
MNLNYQRKTLTALLAASVSLLQPFLSASAENRILLADADDSPANESMLYRPRWSTPGTGHIGKLQLAPIVPPKPAAEAAPTPSAPDASSELQTQATNLPTIQAAPAKPKPRGGAPFEWPHADASDATAQPAGHNSQPVVQHAAQPVGQHATQPIARRVAQPIVQSVAQAAQPVAKHEDESVVTDQAVPPAQAPLKVPRLTLSPPSGVDTDSPALPKPALPRPSLPAVVSNSALPKPALSKPPLPKPFLHEPLSPDPALSNPSAIIPSLSSGNLGETEEQTKPTEAPTPGKHKRNKSAEKPGSPAAFVQPSERAAGLLQTLFSDAQNIIIAFDTTSSCSVTDTIPCLAPPVVPASGFNAPSAPLELSAAIMSPKLPEYGAARCSVFDPRTTAPTASTEPGTDTKSTTGSDASAAETSTSTTDTSAGTSTTATETGAAVTSTTTSAATASTTATSEKQPIIIESGISVWDTANIDRVLETLVDSHFTNSKEAQALDKKVDHFSKAPAKAVAIVKDSLNTSMRIGGTDPSSRGGRIVLDENLKITDKATAEYERQRYVDKIHSHIVSALAEVAMGLGTEDPARRTQIIDAGYKSLSSLVGDDKAKNTVQGLTTWLSRIPVSDETFKKPIWDTIERETKLETVLKAALAKDSVVAEVRRRVYRYAHPGKLKSGTSKVVEGTLATVSWLSPGFAIPIGAEVALDAYIAATGGSEEAKLEKEIIYDKRIQSRLKVLDQEATLALDNYRFAIVTKNPSLLVFSEALIADMANEHVANEVLVGQVITGDVKKQTQQVIPGIKESKTAEQGILKALTKEVTRL